MTDHPRFVNLRDGDLMRLPADRPPRLGLRHVLLSGLAAGLTVFVLPTLVALIIAGGN